LKGFFFFERTVLEKKAENGSFSCKTDEVGMPGSRTWSGMAADLCSSLGWEISANEAFFETERMSGGCTPVGSLAPEIESMHTGQNLLISLFGV
jgi:hypothetical protein